MNRRWRSRIATVLGLPLLVNLAFITSAQASDSLFPGDASDYRAACGDFRPTTGSFLATRSGSKFEVTWNFKLSSSAKAALDCVASNKGQQWLELDLALTGFDGISDWDDYEVIGTNIPGAVHDEAWPDPAVNASPGVTGIPISSLYANTGYYFGIRWSTSSNFYPVSGQQQRVSFEWVPSHWAANPYEVSACLGAAMNKAWCVFGGARTYVSGAYYTYFTSGRDGIPFGSPLSRPLPFPVGGSVGGGNNGGGNQPGGTLPSRPAGGVPSYDGVIRISGTNGLGVNVRNAPNDRAQRVGGISEGVVVHPDCYTRGQNLGGTDLWWKVSSGYYSALYDSTPYEWQNAIEQHYGIQNCAAIVDSDGDGFTDPNDGCPQVHIPANGGCPGKADFNLDGKTDVSAFYRYDGQAVGLWAWNGQSDLYTSSPYSPWGTYDSWEGARFVPAGTGDFNGDRLQDIAAFYSYDGGGMGLDLWYGNSQGGINPFQGWYVPDSWEKERLVPAGVGDFNEDGREDVAAFYYYNGGVVNLYVWYGQVNMYMNGPHTVWTGNGWDGTRIIPVGVGDIDGDGNLDVSAFYRHDGTMIDNNIWFGNGAGGFGLGRPWHRASGWDGSRLIPMGVADINSDGKADTIAIYDHSGDSVDMRAWWGTSNRVLDGEPGGPWSENGWQGERIIPNGTGDYNGDGKADISAFYDYDGQVVGTSIWYGTGTGTMNHFAAWYVPDSWEGERLIPTGIN